MSWKEAMKNYSIMDQALAFLAPYGPDLRNGLTSHAPMAVEPPRESRDTLIDMAVASGDEHVIKFTKACLREYDLNPSPAYLAAVRHCSDILTAN
jgi:hypothetical protein